MSQENLKTKEAVSSKKKIIVNQVTPEEFEEFKKKVLSIFSEVNADDPLSFFSPFPKEEEEEDGDNWVVGFRPLFNVLKKDVGLLYFYPGEVKGFIESCILGLQRPVEPMIRDMHVFRELYAAQKMWYDKMQEDMYIKGVTFYVGDKEISHADFELREAVAVAGYIEDFVRLYTTPIVDALKEPFAIDETSFKWTDAHALIFKTYSGKNHHSR